MVPVLGQNRRPSDQMNQASDVFIVVRYSGILLLETCTFPCVNVDDLAPLYDPERIAVMSEG